jgi:hypothetical protein
VLFSFKHPFYLSVTDLKYNAKEKVMQGSLKIFVNDFENALSKIEHKKVDLLHPNDSLVLIQQIERYVVNHIKLKINDKPIDYKILGFEKEEEAIWLYLESKECALPKKVQIENTLLYETIKEQMNIVQIEVNANKKSLKQNNPQKDFTFEF